MKKIFGTKWHLMLKIIPILALIAILKTLAHHFGIEFLSFSAFFGALISVNIFLIGFILSGVLSDYKEAEKIPGEIASNIDSIADEFIYVHQSKNSPAGRSGFEYCRRFVDNLLAWFNKGIRTRNLMESIDKFTAHFAAVETASQATFISRIKQDQAAIRKQVLRVHTIRETSFSESAYAIAEAISILLVAGMIFLRLDPYHESLFFILFVAFILSYMLFLLRDLDNPFSYYEKDSVEKVSLRPIEDLKSRLEAKAMKFGNKASQ